MVGKPVETLASGPAPGMEKSAVVRKNGYDTSTAPSEQTPAVPAEQTPTAPAEQSAAGTEQILAEMLADVAGVPEVSADSHFFDELGADSLVMAHFCARIRKRADLPSVSMKDVYRNPTIHSLTAALIDAPQPSAPVEPPPDPVPAARTSLWEYVLCGALQLLAFIGYSCVIAYITAQGYEWISAGSGVADVYLRSVVFGAIGFLVLCALPVVVKWTVIGRWKPREIRVWSLGYVRFWLVKTLVRANPLVLFVGSPLYSFYLRLLGAKIGRGVVIFSRAVPVCTDLFTVGDGTVIRKDSFFACYRAHAGRIQTGPVTLGRDVTVSEATVLDIGSSMGDGAQLAHASSLHGGQTVPAGEHWHGSPAVPADSAVDFRGVGPAGCGGLRRAVHSVLQLLTALLVYMPLAVGVVGLMFAEVPQFAAALEPGPAALTSWTFYVEALVASVVLFFGAIPVGLLIMTTLPRLFHRAMTPGRVYPLYGIHYGMHRAIVLITNRKFMTRLFGDSSAIVHYLRTLGYHLSPVEQTGSNFGTDVKHETPYLSSVGTGTMIADGLSMVNADFSNTSFSVSRTSIGPHNFLGNRIAYPSRGRTGDNCLLATKVMVPIDGAVREGVGLLGSPSFEIPRSVHRDSTFDQLKNEQELPGNLAAKSKHNVVTMALYLLVRWLYFTWFTLLVAVTAELYTSLGAMSIALGNVLVLLSAAVYYVLVERAVTALHPLSPVFCSIYDRRFWRRERYWKVPNETWLRIYNGTPYKNLIWRLLGVRLGRRVFDDGCSFTERPLVAVGDHSTLNAGSVVQCHSQEDGTFKSDRSSIGAGCTLGVGAFVHYGVTVGDGAELAPDSFLMKGEAVPQNARWTGNPARPVGRDTGEQWREE
ncbi:Pls/PosA family non-ribosomal peptide synthetase [Streptomyces sp. NPDC058685]|uniref:Pls/PosA family non-ribosomal peptide synthetase n=1 Tax=Streptomyces sp. NPDC058685 TaxID=3346598 RepID=UPI0036677A18